jgi:curved DNA-binding protein CbpA
MGNNTSSRTYEQYYETLQQQQKQQQQRDNRKKSIQIPDDIDPYEVFGLSKNFEWDELKEAYRRIAKLVHPDKGGSEEVFNKVTDCFKVLASEYKLRKSDRQHYELKKEAQDYYTSTQNTRSSDNYNPEGLANFAKKSGSEEKGMDGMSFTERFNKTFEENRLEEEELAKGYGHMMEKSSANREDLTVPTYIKPGKKFDMKSFNKTFETVSLPKSSEVIKYREPEGLPLARKMQYSELGETTDDFSSAPANRDSRGLQYTDYMKAYSAERLVDPRSVDKRKNYKTVGEYENAREKVLAKPPTEEELRWKAMKEREAEEIEELRLRRLAERDRVAAIHHEKMNQLLLGGR